MKQLSYETDPTHGIVQPTAKIQMRSGKDREFWVCNPKAEIDEAIEEGKPFIAHMVIGFKPIEKTINPLDISTVEQVV